LALLERIAEAVVKREMVTPALILLESLGPLNFWGSQALHGLLPFLEAICSSLDLDRMARILERRESIALLIEMIEQKTRERN